MTYLILGSPGSGKGSVATLLEKEKAIKHIATGDRLRNEVRSKSDLGKRVKSIIDKGDLVDDQTMIEIIQFSLNENRNVSCLLDGFPRTLEQSKLLEKITEVKKAILLYVNPNIVVKRILGRRICENCKRNFNVHFRPSKVENICDVCKGNLQIRSDDVEQNIHHRLEVYKKNIVDLKSFYRERGVLSVVDGDDSIINVYNKVMNILEI